MHIARWLAVLPASILAALLVAFPLHWLTLLWQTVVPSATDSTGTLWLLHPNVFERLGQALFTPVVMLYTASHVAPSHRFYAALAALLLYLVLLGVALGYIFLVFDPHQSWGYLEMGMITGLGITGAIWGLYTAYAAYGLGEWAPRQKTGPAEEVVPDPAVGNILHDTQT